MSENGGDWGFYGRKIRICQAKGKRQRGMECEVREKEGKELGIGDVNENGGKVEIFRVILLRRRNQK